MPACQSRSFASRAKTSVQRLTIAWGKGGYVFTGPWGSAVVPNITSHPKSGIGAWTDAEIRRALTHGVSRDGREFKPPMARQNYFSRMTEEDLNALVAWMRTIPPLE